MWDGKLFLTWPTHVTQWLWENGPEYGLERHVMDEFCLRMTMRRLSFLLLEGREQAEGALTRYLSPKLLVQIENHEITFLDDLFFPHFEVERSDASSDILEAQEMCWQVGDVWLSLLEQLGIDILAYIAHELRAHPGNLLNDQWIYGTPYELQDRTIVVEGSEEGGFKLAWCWADDSREWGLIASEFIHLLFKEDNRWPFAERDAIAQSQTRRKKVPGSWIN